MGGAKGQVHSLLVDALILVLSILRVHGERSKGNAFSELFSEQFTEQQWGVTCDRSFSGIYTHTHTYIHTFCAVTGLHFNHLLPSVRDCLLLEITIDW